jgi:YegS/Rv2252/BmrU family lipid kinase
MPKAFVVQNPVAGSQATELVTSKLREFFKRVGWQHQIYQTQPGDDVPSIARSAAHDGYDLLIAAGGDGTVSAVATGISEFQIPMGILPAGTGNGLARDLKIPLALDRALEVIYKRAEIRALDAIQVGERYFLLNLSAGLTPKAMEETDRVQKRQVGRLAYILAGLRLLGGVQPSTYYLEIDGSRHKVRASEVLLLNSMNLGDTGRILQLDIHNDDGRLDLFVVESKTSIDYLRAALNILLRRENEEPEVQRFAVRDQIRIRGNRRLLVQADGDIIGHTPVTAKLVKSLVQVITPKT